MSEEKTQSPVSFRLETGRFSNTLVHQWFWSVKRNKWIRGNCHAGLNWGCDYLVYPGVYVLFSLSGFLDNRGLTLRVERVYIRDDASVEDRNVLAEVTIPYRQFIQMFPPFKVPNIVPEALRDFLDGRPRHYHSVSASPPSEKQYPEDEIERVVSYLRALPYQFAESE